MASILREVLASAQGHKYQFKFDNNQVPFLPEVDESQLFLPNFRAIMYDYMLLQYDLISNATESHARTPWAAGSLLDPAIVEAGICLENPLEVDALAFLIMVRGLEKLQASCEGGTAIRLYTRQDKAGTLPPPPAHPRPVTPPRPSTPPRPNTPPNPAALQQTSTPKVPSSSSGSPPPPPSTPPNLSRPPSPSSPDPTHRQETPPVPSPKVTSKVNEALKRKHNEDPVLEDKENPSKKAKKSLTKPRDTVSNPARRSARGKAPETSVGHNGGGVKDLSELATVKGWAYVSRTPTPVKGFKETKLPI
ncbi:hypothetical protein DFP72DRAFT_1163438 [Ephemerocybe angulata]|uniref:Uncharacterized protein n=1 Tax=Ephemerocybe angulata TaxID=980116 RepID=A0A8H6IHX2_9AGAR|nr:hypothetical protein DFP72DRAFT_1163438 [Tulosesus angulatus]